MTTSDFIPELQPMVEHLSLELRFVCYFILTGSIIVKVAHAHNGSIAGLMRPIVTATFICGLIATLPFWFNLIRDEFWNIAMTIRGEYAPDAATTSKELLKLLKPSDEGTNWLDIADSVMKAVQFALGWLIVCIGALIQLPMLLVQFVMECLCYLFLPIALSLFALDSTRGLGIRYLQQTLAILAWPIGFAVVDLVGYSLLTSAVSGVSAGALVVGLATKFTPATMIIGGLVAIWLLLGSLATPIVMQMLFCSGSPLSSAVGAALQLGLAAAGLSRLSGGGGGGGKASPSTSYTPSASSGSSSSVSVGVPTMAGQLALPGGDQKRLPPPDAPGMAPLPSGPKPPPAPAGAALSIPRGYTQPARQAPTYDLTRDPGGDSYSVDLMNQNQILQPISY